MSHEDSSQFFDQFNVGRDGEKKLDEFSSRIGALLTDLAERVKASTLDAPGAFELFKEGFNAALSGHGVEMRVRMPQEHSSVLWLAPEATQHHIHSLPGHMCMCPPL